MADAAARRIADRYATALYDVAEAGRALEAVEADLAFLQQCLTTSPELVRIVQSESVADPEKLRALLALMAVHKAHVYTINSLKTLAKHQRLVVLIDVVAAFARVAEARAGITVAQVTTAAPLTAEQQTTLDAALARRLGKRLRVVARVDSALLDGLTVQVGSHLYDASLHGKLHRLESHLRAAAL